MAPLTVRVFSGRYARRSTEWEATPLCKVWRRVYSEGGSGEPTQTTRLAGATPQPLGGAIPRGQTSSIAHSRKAVGRRVAAQRVQRMGRKVHSPHSRHIPSFFVSIVMLAADDAAPVIL